MFDRIAHRYDLLNRLISFGLDRGWRRKLLRALGDPPPGSSVLDVATGTADVALDIAKEFEGVSVIGLDPSTEMLRFGRKKTAEDQLDARVELIEGDAQAMPFDDDQFAASCISFGIRNVPDRLKGLSEMARVTEPGGKVVVLELSEPRSGLMAPFARFHIHYVVPFVGSLLSGDKEYKYLAQSIQEFPPADEFGEMMEQAGLTQIEIQPMIFGVAHLYVGTVA
jgi:demethylmenaquinone methyltransferase/2-methoxy-6-polyprenyl-1,4-benzoquinol methylase